MTAVRESNPLAQMSSKTLRSLGDTVASLPPREATLVTMPGLHPELVEALGKMGASRLY